MKKLIALVLVLVGIGYSQSATNTYPVFIATDSIVRPANATQYSVNDVVNDTASTARLFRFQGVLRSGGKSSVILSGLMEVDTANVTNGTFKLLLFTDTVGTASDNSAWTPSHANNDKYVGSIDFSLSSNGTGVAMAEAAGVNIPVYSLEGTSYLYGVLLAKGQYTPKFNGKVRVKLGLLRY